MKHFLKAYFLGSLWLLERKTFRWFLGCLYCILYGAIRFVLEYFLEPDVDLGYRVAAVADAPIYLNVSIFNLSTGQLLCLFMVASGLLCMVFVLFLINKNKTKS